MILFLFNFYPLCNITGILVLWNVALLVFKKIEQGNHGTAKRQKRKEAKWTEREMYLFRFNEIADYCTDPTILFISIRFVEPILQPIVTIKYPCVIIETANYSEHNYFSVIRSIHTYQSDKKRREYLVKL